MPRVVKYGLTLLAALALAGTLSACQLMAPRSGANPAPNGKTGGASQPTAAPILPEPKPTVDLKSLSPLEHQWGIKIESIHLSAAAYMVDFRFRVLDPKKAAPLLDRANKPYLIDEATGNKMLVPDSPKTGPLRQTEIQPKPNRVYWLFFANPGRRISSGSKVTVVIGDFKAEHLSVQ